MFDYRSVVSRLIWLFWLILPWVPGIAFSAEQGSIAEDFPTRKVVVIDPGHGGHDSGAVGPSGLTEKAVTLMIAQEIREILSAPYEVHLTRDDDSSVDIEHRTETANHYRAKLFVSVHAGGAFGHQGRGTVVFYHRQRGTDTVAGPYPQYGDSWEIGERPNLWNDIQSRHTTRSRLLAQTVHRHLTGEFSPVDNGVRTGPLLVLRGADMPAILVEVAHLSHPAEEAQLRKPEVMSAVAQAISEAVKEYFRKPH